MAVQQVINHIHNGVDFVKEHAETDSAMVLHDSNKLSDFLEYMLPITGGLGITGKLNVNGDVELAKNLTLNKELIFKSYYNPNVNNGASIWLNNVTLTIDRVLELLIASGGVKANSFKATELGFYQEFADETSVRMDGRGGGSSYGVGWYFSNAKGTFVDLYAKNIQNQCDARVKDIMPATKEIKSTPNPVENITPKRYKYHGEEKIRYGFIAQELEPYIPEAVTTIKYDPNENNIPVDKYGNKILDCKTVDLMAVVATLWTKVQELSLDVATLKELISK